MKFHKGSVFGNRYTLGDRIAVGGMGEVWRATDGVLGRTVAMKLLSPSLAEQPGFIRRFREEARNTAMLQHPNIAAVYDYGEDAGASWLVMELVEGEPLSTIIREEGPIEPRRAASIVAQAASALQAAHDAGVIHRDVKPANILVRPDGQVKLTDFGIARAVDAAPITRTGEVMGTAQYISPEQATGKPAGPASDIYSLGVVAHEMLSGTRPFDEGSPVATAMAHIHNDPPPLPDGVGQPLAGVVMASLAKDPGNRPPSAAVVASALRGGPEAAAFDSTEVFPSDAGPTQAMHGPAPTMVQPPAPTGRTGYPPPGYPPQGGYPGQYGQGYPGYPTGPMPEQKKKSNPWVWIVPVLLLLVLGGFFLAQSGLLSGGTSQETTPPVTPTTEVTTPTPTTPTTQDSVRLDNSRFAGMTVEQAQSELRSLGFSQTTINQQSNNDVAAERVISINPSGDVSPGAIITLNVSTGPEQTTPPPAESPETTPPPDEEEESPPTDEQSPGTQGAADPGEQSGAGDAQAEGGARGSDAGGVAGANAGANPGGGSGDDTGLSSNQSQGQGNSADQKAVDREAEGR
ncbi:serine/threonine-protein kinase [Kineosphaera limosa]|uniref:non-specific serine/threonine protein kinase n=1 Tax=Kineosphaera limosa NBRC 100340 TaxID=1184609 RepID=K6WTG4_9MICO|nr:protein kinase [Kineosphaera limosa]NYE00991.1 serine/threonine-protein kinase [Kineosphaera limosa]GAB95377.1 serine/threonine protein kinase PknB [Kineosphaera limosa NBRC 100340]